jgi:hypothetical protein
METNPLPEGAFVLLPPWFVLPHTLIVPVVSSAAKAKPVEAMETNPLPEGALVHSPSFQ